MVRAVIGVGRLGSRGRVLMRTDGEPALVALRNAIVKGLPDGATPISTPVGESSSNGVMEVAVKIMKGILRVHLAALEKKIGTRFPPAHAVLTRLVEHVTVLIPQHTVRVYFKTAYDPLYRPHAREAALSPA